MKYLHIMSTGNPVSKSFPRFIREHFPASEHAFLIIGSDISAEELPHGCAVLRHYDHAAVMAQIKRHDHVLIHGLSLSTRTKLQLLRPQYLQKLVWVAWGADLYQRAYASGPLCLIKRSIDTGLKNRFPRFVGIFKPDIDHFLAAHNANAETFFAKYPAGLTTGPSIYDTQPVLRPISQRLQNGQTVQILVGHQANPLLDHISVLHMLERFKDENIHICIPLSYGDPDYAQQVTDLAEHIFREKVTVLRKFVPYEEYMEYLQNIDIAIFHIDRQIGLGNIYPLLFMQKKLYLKSSGVMHRQFTAEGLQVCASEDLQTASFEEFTKDTDLSLATEYVRMLHDPLADKERWETVFSALT